MWESLQLPLLTLLLDAAGNIFEEMLVPCGRLAVSIRAASQALGVGKLAGTSGYEYQ